MNLFNIQSLANTQEVIKNHLANIEKIYGEEEEKLDALSPLELQGHEGTKLSENVRDLHIAHYKIKEGLDRLKSVRT